MAVRVSADEVREILSTSLSDPAIEAFIGVANITVTKLLGGNADLSAAQLKEIERWLAAHLIACTRDRQVASEGADAANATYTGQTAMGLDATFYGQQLKILDTTGTLANQLGKKTASLYAVKSFD